MSRTDSAVPFPPRAASGCLIRTKGLILLVSAVAVGVLGWLVLNLLAGNLRKEPDHANDIAGFARWMIDHRGIVSLLVLPVAMVALWLLLRRKQAANSGVTIRIATPWIVTALATLWLVAVFALVLATFVLFLAPLYQYRDLG